ncbi:hypothetical protein [Methanolapillus millepedarum]|uniref:Uncharacterized protein n=1 Tax=Methanolapillus millepedarum TaxID=3028296 RepID=A0AA96V2P9_9EURY|nr:hypothetical protein MsAc7_03780 [Methanosarcinaceae archaeon Ac7]
MKLTYSTLFAVAAIVLLLTVLPMNADAKTVTVGTSGDYSTLADAVVALNAEPGNDHTITVLENITITKRAYIVDKNITIQGINPDIVITRGAGFSAASDTQRSWFNPGMLEVAVSNVTDNSKWSEVILKNITFDDANNPDVAIMTNSTPQGAPDPVGGYAVHVYDSVLSAYDSKTKITMGEGAKIKNPGGYSAIMLTNGASCVMENGSTIGGNINSLRGIPLIRMVNNVKLTFNATITDLNNSSKVIILTENGGTIDFYGNISNCNVTHVIQSGGSNVILHKNSKISGNNKANAGAVYISGGSLNISGEISNNTCTSNNGGAIYAIWSGSLILSESGNISNNTVQASSGGGSGGGVYLNHNSTMTMNGGKISGNQALGPFSTNSSNSDFGGGGVSIVRGSSFTMNGGTISDNKAAAGGGVFLAGKADTYIGPRFIFNNGTIKNNLVTDSTNATYGNDIALGVTKTNASSENFVGATGGHSIFISKTTVVGDKLIGISVRDSSNASNSTGYHQAVHVENFQSAMLFGTLNATQSTELFNSLTTHDAGYGGSLKNSLWVDSKTTGPAFSFVNILPIPGDQNDYEYLAIVTPLNATSGTGGSTAQYITPTRVSNGLELNVTKDAAAVNGYAVVIAAKTKAGPLTLNISHDGDGEFYFISNPTATSATINPGSSENIYTKAADGWKVKSVTLTAADGSVFSKTVTGDQVVVNYSELSSTNATTANIIHAVFEKNGSDPSGGTGSANVTDPKTTPPREEAGGFEEPAAPPSKSCQPVPIKEECNMFLINAVLSLIALILAILLLLLLLRRRKEKKNP